MKILKANIFLKLFLFFSLVLCSFSLHSDEEPQEEALDKQVASAQWNPQENYNYYSPSLKTASSSKHDLTKNYFYSVDPQESEDSIASLPLNFSSAEIEQEALSLPSQASTSQPQLYYSLDSKEKDLRKIQEKILSPPPSNPNARVQLQSTVTQAEQQQFWYNKHKTDLIAQNTRRPRYQPPPLLVEKPPLYQEKVLINFSDVSIIEFIKFISKAAKKNFIFKDEDLDFTTSFISEERITIDQLVTTLSQVLTINSCYITEDGSNLMIHKEEGFQPLSHILGEKEQVIPPGGVVVTKIFKLKILDPDSAKELLEKFKTPMGRVESIEGTQNLIVTDTANIIEDMSVLLTNLDSPTSSLALGEYILQNVSIDYITEKAESIFETMAPDKIKIVPHNVGNSILIVATPFLVEKAISVLQRIDIQSGGTGIVDINNMQFNTPKRSLVITDVSGRVIGRWRQDKESSWIYYPIDRVQPNVKGRWKQDQNKTWYFDNKDPSPRSPSDPTPKGIWGMDPTGKAVFKLDENEKVTIKEYVVGSKRSKPKTASNLDKTVFYIHKLLYRNPEDLTDAISGIAEVLGAKEKTTPDLKDLVAVLESIQGIDETKSLLMVGNLEAIEKAKLFINELDIPLRQVFIECCIVETTIDDALTLGVEWSTRNGYYGNCSLPEGNKHAVGSTGFLSIPGEDNPVISSQDSMNDPDTAFNAKDFITQAGYHLGAVGRFIIKGGREYYSIASFIKALRTNKHTRVLMAPKLLTQDSKEASLEVGSTRQYTTTSTTVAGSENVEKSYVTRELGTTLQITPKIGPNDVIDMEIDLEIDEEAGEDENSPTKRSHTVTKVRVPDGYFLSISGMIRSSETSNNERVPCLGGLPLIGGAFGSKLTTEGGRSLMIFIKPKIIDTDRDIEELTKAQNNAVNRHSKSGLLDGWKSELSHFLQLLNLKGKGGFD